MVRKRALRSIGIPTLLVSVLGSNFADAGHWYWALAKTTDVVKGIYNDSLKTYVSAKFKLSANSSFQEIRVEHDFDKGENYSVLDQWYSKSIDTIGIHSALAKN